MNWAGAVLLAGVTAVVTWKLSRTVERYRQARRQLRATIEAIRGLMSTARFEAVSVVRQWAGILAVAAIVVIVVVARGRS